MPKSRDRFRKKNKDKDKWESPCSDGSLKYFNDNLDASNKYLKYNKKRKHKKGKKNPGREFEKALIEMEQMIKAQVIREVLGERKVNENIKKKKKKKDGSSSTSISSTSISINFTSDEEREYWKKKFDEITLVPNLIKRLKSADMNATNNGNESKSEVNNSGDDENSNFIISDVPENEIVRTNYFKDSDKEEDENYVVYEEIKEIKYSNKPNNKQLSFTNKFKNESDDDETEDKEEEKLGMFNEDDEIDNLGRNEGFENNYESDLKIIVEENEEEKSEEYENVEKHQAKKKDEQNNAGYHQEESDEYEYAEERQDECELYSAEELELDKKEEEKEEGGERDNQDYNEDVVNEEEMEDALLRERMISLSESIKILRAQLAEEKRALAEEKKQIVLPGHICTIAEPCSVAAQLEERLRARREAAAASYCEGLQQVEQMVTKEMSRLEQDINKLEPLNKLAADWEIPHDSQRKAIMYRHDYMLVAAQMNLNIPNELKSYLKLDMNQLQELETAVNV